MASAWPRVLALALALLIPVLAGCVSSPAGPTGDWAREAQAHGPVGLEATLDATAGPAGGTLTGTSLGSIRAPLALLPEVRGFDETGAVFFDATLPAIGTGILMLAGDHINVTEGEMHKAPIAGVDAEDTLHVSLARTFGERVDTDSFPDGFENESNAYFIADHIVIDIRDWKVTGHDRAVWFSGRNAEELAGPFTFDATRMHWVSGSSLEAAALQATFDHFAWATDEPSGTLTAETLGTIDAPLGVFGQDAEFRLDGRAIESARPFRLTQAVTEDGFLLDAEVQLEPEEDRVAVNRGDTAWARVFYREHGYIGAAVVEDIRISGPGAELIEVPLSSPPLHVEALWDTLGAYPWFAQPFAALAFAIASPFVLLVDAIEGIVCAFSFCPKDHPYPVWMEPGQHGGFYYRVNGNAPEGEYPATVSVHGANHDPVTFDVTIVVRPEA